MSCNVHCIRRSNQQFDVLDSLTIVADDLQVQVSESGFVAAVNRAAREQAFGLDGHGSPFIAGHFELSVRVHKQDATDSEEALQWASGRRIKATRTDRE